MLLENNTGRDSLDYLSSKGISSQEIDKLMSFSMSRQIVLADQQTGS